MKGNGGPATSRPMDAYTLLASNSVRPPAAAAPPPPPSGRAPVVGGAPPPQPATPIPNSVTATTCLTCSTSNPGVSFARSHAQREPRRPHHRRLPPPRTRRRGRHGGSVPRRAPRAWRLCVQSIALGAAERPHRGPALPARGGLRLAGPQSRCGAHLRLWRSRRPPLPGARVGCRQVPRRVRTPRRAARFDARGEPGAPARRRARRGAPGGHHPSRLEAREHRVRPGDRAGEAARLRDCPRRRAAARRAPHAHRLLRGHSEVRRPRGPFGRAGRRPRGHLQSRDDRLLAAHGPLSPHRAQPARVVPAALERPAGSAQPGGPGAALSGRARSGRHARPGARSGPPSADRDRVSRRGERRAGGGRAAQARVVGRPEAGGPATRTTVVAVTTTSDTMTSAPDLERRLRELLRERSIARGDFVLASGKRSSFYIDARRTTMSGEGFAVIGALGLARLGARGWTPALVGGLTPGADPVAYAIGATVVVVEDVITTGRSAAEAIAAVTAEGGRVLGVLAVVDREEGGRSALERAGHAVETLVTATDLGLA